MANGEVKAEDLDPSIQIREGGGETPGFSLQVTERSNRAQVLIGGGHYSLNVQCNSDEVVTVGGYSVSEDRYNQPPQNYAPAETRKQDNGWSVTLLLFVCEISATLSNTCLLSELLLYHLA